MWESIRINGIIPLIGHISMMQMFSFNFWFYSGSGAHFHSKSFQRFIYCNKIEHLHSWKECVRVNSNLWYYSINWSYLYDADVFFQFRVLIRVQELISIRNQSRDSIIVIKLNTYTLGKSVWELIRISLIFHLIGHISMMQMFSFNFGFWFGFRSSFQFGISPEIHLL